MKSASAKMVSGEKHVKILVLEAGLRLVTGMASVIQPMERVLVTSTGKAMNRVIHVQ